MVTLLIWSYVYWDFLEPGNKLVNTVNIFFTSFTYLYMSQFEKLYPFDGAHQTKTSLHVDSLINPGPAEPWYTLSLQTE